MVEVLLRFKPNMLIAAHDGMFFLFVMCLFLYHPLKFPLSIHTCLYHNNCRLHGLAFRCSERIGRVL